MKKLIEKLKKWCSEETNLDIKITNTDIYIDLQNGRD